MNREAEVATMSPCLLFFFIDNSHHFYPAAAHPLTAKIERSNPGWSGDSRRRIKLSGYVFSGESFGQSHANHTSSSHPCVVDEL